MLENQTSENLLADEKIEYGKCQICEFSKLLQQFD